MMFALIDSIRLNGHFGRETSICLWTHGPTHGPTHERTDNGRVLTSVYTRRRWGGGEKRD